MCPDWKAACLALILGFAPALSAEPTIVHAGLECIAPGRFAVVLSGIDPELEIQTAKVFFRSELYADFYWVTMKHQGGRFIGILPQASPETPRVIYYLEAVDQTFAGVRSEEFDPVVGDCDEDPALPYLAGGTPEIVVGATTAGAAALPPGFAAAGIVGTIAATGIASSVGAGVGTGVVIAGAAGAAAVVVVAQGQGSTSTIVGAAPPSSSVTTSASSSGNSTSSTTSIAPGPTTSASSTTTTILGGTTTVPGGSSSTTTTVSGSSTTTSVGPTTTSTSSSSTTTSSISTTTTTVSSLNASCFTVEIKGPCHVHVHAECVSEPVDRYDWVLDTQNKFKRIDIRDGKKEEHQDWKKSECDQSQSITFRLTVFRGSESSTAEKTVHVPSSLQSVQASEPLDLSLETRLELASPDNRSRGRILIDGRLSGTVVGGQASSVRTRLSPGAHELEAVVKRSPGEPGLWNFDFSASPAFQGGSLRVLQGNVLTMGPSTVTFRLGGEPEEHLRLRFELAP
jgi:hypothetical protein